MNSKLRPHGVKINFNNEERELLFTLNVVDELQNRSEKSLPEFLKDMLDRESESDISPIKTILSVLLQDEAERKEFLTGEKIKTYTEKEVGWILNLENYAGYMEKILEAYGISMPSADDLEDIEDEVDDDDPNSTRATDS